MNTGTIPAASRCEVVYEIFFRASTISAFIIAGCLLSQVSLSGEEQKKAQGKRLASVNGIAITEAQVRKESADDLESLELKKLKEKASFARNEQEILENALERLVEEKLLAAEAAKQGISKEELIAKEIDGKVPENPQARRSKASTNRINSASEWERKKRCPRSENISANKKRVARGRRS